MIVFDAIDWCWSHKREAAEGLLVALLVVTVSLYNHDRSALKKQAEEANGLAAGIGQELRITRNQLEILRRDSSGKIVYRNIYVPPEGSVIIDQKEKSALESQIADLTAKLNAAISKGDSTAADKLRKEIGAVDPGLAVKVIDHGWTFRPGFRADYSGDHGIGFGLDFKYYYWKRLGAVFGGTKNGIGPGLSYHLDQLPGHPRNLELYVDYNVVLNTPGHPVAGGLRIDF